MRFIIKKFLFERFNLRIRIPNKYVIMIEDKNINYKFRENDNYKNSDGNRGELQISDGFDKFLLNPKVKNF